MIEAGMKAAVKTSRHKKLILEIPEILVRILVRSPTYIQPTGSLRRFSWRFERGQELFQAASGAGRPWSRPTVLGVQVGQ
jgi:hypothetical protein